MTRAIERWCVRIADMPDASRLGRWQEAGLRLILPGDPEWPTQLDNLGGTRPILLWAHGGADLRLSAVNSVSLVGARASTGYGNHVAIEMAAHLAERGVTIVWRGACATKSESACTMLDAIAGTTCHADDSAHAAGTDIDNTL